MAKERSRSAEKAEVNRNVRVAVRRFEVPGLREENWTFLCECGDEECREWVALTLAEFEARRDVGEPILAEGHELSRAEQARRQARTLADGARALRAQAGVETGRVRRRDEKS